MIRRDVELTEAQDQALLALADRTGKSHQDLIREAVDRYLRERDDQRRLDNIMQAAGMWKDRDDLPDFDEIRKSWDRSL